MLKDIILPDNSLASLVFGFLTNDE